MLGWLARLGIVLVVGLAPAVSSADANPASPTGQAGFPRSGAVGYDVGEFSCNGTLPSGGSFGVIGVTAGRPFHPSTCLGAEYQWARSRTYRPQYYLNLADPGHKSSHWGAGGPRACNRKARYDTGCAYDYGVKAAAAALRYIKSVGSSGDGRWWADVEPDNTWGASRAGIAANVAVIKGALHFLRGRPGTSAGVYTETIWWAEITGDARMRHTAVWGGGAGSKRNARHNCRRHSITGGPALLAQWIVGSNDHDLAC